MIAVLDYGIGNLRSAQKALEHLGADARLVSDPDAAASASGIVLPGVGAFGPCVRALRRAHLDEVAVASIKRGLPFLAICVGFQMLYESSEEDQGTPGLGVLRGRVVPLPKGEKRPQMQWNVISVEARSRMLEGLGASPWVYFVHSYAPEPTPECVAFCDYGGQIVAAIERETLWGTQFHPEKSGSAGLSLLANFVRACNPG